MIVHYWTLLHLGAAELIVGKFTRTHNMHWLRWQREVKRAIGDRRRLHRLLKVIDGATDLIYVITFIDLAEVRVEVEAVEEGGGLSLRRVALVEHSPAG